MKKFNRTQALAAKSFRRFIDRELNNFIDSHNFLPARNPETGKIENTSIDPIVMDHIQLFHFWLRSATRRATKQMTESNVNIHGEKKKKNTGA